MRNVLINTLLELLGGTHGSGVRGKVRAALGELLEFS